MDGMPKGSTPGSSTFLCCPFAIFQWSTDSIGKIGSSLIGPSPWTTLIGVLPIRLPVMKIHPLINNPTQLLSEMIPFCCMSMHRHILQNNAHRMTVIIGTAFIDVCTHKYLPCLDTVILFGACFDAEGGGGDDAL